MALLAPIRLKLLAPALALLAALALFTVLSRSETPRPAASAGDDGVAALKAGMPTPQRIAILQATIRSHPRDPGLWAALGEEYYQRVREIGDFSYYVKAEGVFAKALRIAPRNVSATVGMATIALARHDFSGGLRLARRAQRLGPEQLAWYPGLIDAQVELGRYGAAARTLQRFVDTRPNLASYARVSYFHELHGDLPGAVRAMRYAISAGGGAPENVAYVQSLLGDLQVLRGRLDAARRAYRLALTQVPGYVPAGVGLAQVDAAQRRFGPAIAGLRDAVQRLPLPQYIAALGEAELAAGRPAAARDDFALIGAEERLLAANGVNTDVDLALFEANHGNARRAVGLGRRAWEEAPSVRSADALGWALTRNGHPVQGLAWGRRALELGSRDPNFLYHAGISARDAGRRALARSYLTRAVALNPRFSPLYGPRAEHALRSLR